PPRYLNADSPAPDVQLQHWIQTLCRGNRQHLNHPYQDRNRSFDLLLRESSNRFEHPTFVETGTIRSEEDWSGAGFSTYIFGQYLQRHGGVLHSVDLTPAHCEFARTWTECFGETVQVHQSDSLKFLQDFGRPIDVLYLDSLDTTEPGHADHAYEEYQRASPWLHDRSLVLFDDTPWNQGAFVGKGARAVPWLLNNGWRILYAGYQVLLERDNP
ncbi:MAG: class I SAM-dependent methyltransferase, partial [Planctomycetaceae bacterium]|nr:class I SAM-dependent methyltransferase [Planctomycetaceae bacterium]